jgi:hypothetical protein
MSDGGPAFPQNDLSGYGMGPVEDSDGTFKMNGISIRDYFAGKALAYPIGRPGADAMTVARRAYEIADAMIAIRAGEL